MKVENDTPWKSTSMALAFLIFVILVEYEEHWARKPRVTVAA